MESLRSKREAGFSLVELMVVVAMVAILAAVGTPSYINYINRVKQSEATSQLLVARIEMELFYADNLRYTGTIGCLPSFRIDASCATDCKPTLCKGYRNASGACNNIGCYKYYISEMNPITLQYRIAATRHVYSYAQDDNVTIDHDSLVPKINNTDALKFSVYKWLFD